MNIIVLIYLILVIVSFNILYSSGAYKSIYVVNCHKNPVLFAIGSFIATVTGPIWIMVGVIEAFIR